MLVLPPAQHIDGADNIIMMEGGGWVHKGLITRL